MKVSRGSAIDSVYRCIFGPSIFCPQNFVNDWSSGWRRELTGKKIWVKKGGWALSSDFFALNHIATQNVVYV